MELFAASGLINAITAISFGILVISKNWRERANQLFFLMTLALAIWGFGYWKWLSSVDHDTALVWLRILSVGSLFIPTFFFHWVVSVLGQEKLHRVLITLSYFASIVIAFTSGTDLFISGVGKRFIFDYWPSAGTAYSVYFSYIYIGLILYTFYLLVRFYYLLAEPDKKGQILYILFGALLGFGGGLTNFPLWYDIAIYPYGNFLVAAFPFLLGYSVLKYKLFNAKVIATEILVFFIAIILFAQALLSQSVTEFVLRGALATLVAVFGYLLIRSVYREVEQREKIQKLAGDLERVNEKLATANERLKELDQLKSEFVSLATHQIRGPLTAMKGYASMILEGDYGEVPQNLRETIDTIYQSSKSLAVIVDDFLNVSRIEQGRMKYELTTFDICALVNEAVNEAKPNIEKKGLAVSVSLCPEPINVRGDRGKIKQVIGNILDNAAKYTQKGSINVSLVSDKAKGQATLAIKDTGVGIRPETIPHLFQKFSRAEDASKFNIFGTGLGLYVAKEMIKAHGGRIWVESFGEGKGSTFFVELDYLPL